MYVRKYRWTYSSMQSTCRHRVRSLGVNLLLIHTT